MTNDNTSTPPHQPESTPRSFGGNNEWVLKAVADMSSSIGSLQQSVNDVEKTLTRIENRLEKVDDKVCSMDKKMYAAGVIVFLIVAVGGFITHKAVDFGMVMAKESIAAQQRSNASDSNKADNDE